MNTQHTPGRLKVQHPHAGERGWEIALEPGLEQVCQDVTEANARRLVACWNACEGISTDELETTGGAAVGWTRTASKLMHATKQRDQLLAALKAIIADGLHCDVVPHLHKKARAAIAKAEGGAA